MTATKAWKFTDLLSTGEPVVYVLEDRGGALLLRPPPVGFLIGLAQATELADSAIDAYTLDTPLRILKHFIETKGEPFHRDQLIEAVWPDTKDRPKSASEYANLRSQMTILRNHFHDLKPKPIAKGVMETGRLFITVAKSAILRFGGHNIVLPEEKLNECPLPIRLKTLEEFPGVERLHPNEVRRLLQPRFRAIDFTARETECKTLWNWLHSDDLPVSVQVLVGPGGRGKTRLGIRLLELLRKESQRRWHAGFLEGPLSAELFYQWQANQPTLIIIDDASRCADVLAQDVIPRFSDLPDVLPLRILLIERGADEVNGWYRKVLTAERSLFPNEPLRLRELDHGGEDDFWERTQLLNAALARLGTFTGKPKLTIDDAATARLRSSEMGDPLVLLMAAIVAYEIGDLSPLAWRRIQLAEYLADQEEKRITRLTMPKPQFLPLHMAAYVCLSGGLTSGELAAACEQEKNAVQPGSPWDSIELAQLIQEKLLPSEVISEGEELLSKDAVLAASPIVPDIVSEVFLERVLAGTYQQPMQSIGRAFHQKPGAVVRSLIHMVQDFAPADISDTLQRQKTALNWLASLLERENNVESLSEADLWEITSALPHGSVALAELAEQARSFYKRICSVGGIPDWLSAPATYHLAQWERQLGNDAEALRLSSAAVDKYCQLYESHLTTCHLKAYYARTYVRVVADHVVVLSDNGLAQDALETSLAAVQFCRDGQEDVGGFLAQLAGALINHASALADAGELDTALESIREAIRHYRESLVPSNREAFLRPFAVALADQSEYERRLGKLSDARQSADESLRYYHELARTNPDEFLPDLAKSLGAYSQMCRYAFQHPTSSSFDALRAAEEGVSICEQLVARNRQMFLEHLAGAVLLQALAEGDLADKKQQALNSIQQASAYFEELALRNHLRYLPRLARCRSIQAQFCTFLGDMSNAIDLARQSVQDYQELVRYNRSRFLPDLFHGLSNYAETLRKNDRPDEALGPIAESISYGKEFVRANPLRFLADLSLTYAIWGAISEAQGEHVKAAELFAEALRLIKPVAIRLPDAHWSSACNIAESYERAYVAATQHLPNSGFIAPFGRPVPTNPAAERIEVVREFYRQAPREKLPVLAQLFQGDAERWGEAMLTLAEEVMERHASLPAGESASAIVIMQERASRLEFRTHEWSKRGYTKEALDAVSEAVPFVRLLAQESPTETFRAALASDLFTRGQLQYQMGEKENALESVEEATARCSSLVTENSQGLKPALASWLATQARWQYDLGRKAQAMQSTRELVRHYRDLAIAYPERFHFELAQWLLHQALLHSELGLKTEAAESLAGGVAVYKQLVPFNREATLPQLWTLLLRLALYQNQAGSCREAVSSIKEMIAVLRELVERHPEEFLPKLAEGLYDQAQCQYSLAENDAEAETAVEEALDLFRSVAANKPELFEQQGLRDAVVRSQGLWGRLVFRGSSCTQIPAKFERQLRLTLSQLSRLIPGIDDACVVLRAGYLLACRMAGIEPNLTLLAPLATRFPPHKQFVSIGVFLPNDSAPGRPIDITLPESLLQIDAAVDLNRDRCRTERKAARLDLAFSRQHQSEVLAELNRKPEALEAVKEATAHLRKLAAANPAEYLPYLARGLNLQADVELKVGRKPQASRCITESVKLWRKRCQSDSGCLSEFAYALGRHARIRYENRQRTQAFQSAVEAIQHYTSLATDDPRRFVEEVKGLLVLCDKLAECRLQLSKGSSGQCPIVVRTRLTIKSQRLKPSAQLLVDQVEKLLTIAHSNPDHFVGVVPVIEWCRIVFLIELGQGTAALHSIAGSVECAEELSHKAPDVRPLVALMRCVWGTLLWNCDSGMPGIAQAADMFAAGLATIAPFALESPESHSSTVGVLRAGYLRACDALGTVPSATLLDQFAEDKGS